MLPIHRRKAVMALILLALIVAPVALIASKTARTADEKPGPLGAGGAARLANGWKITPAGTHHEDLGDLLLGGVLSPDGKWLAFVNGGAAAHQVHLADTSTGKVVASVPVERAQSSGGVTFSPDGAKLFVSGGNAGRIYVFAVGEGGTLTKGAPLLIPDLKTALDPRPDPGADAGRDPARQDATEERAYLGGLALSPDGATLYVANLAGDSLFRLDTATGAVQQERRLAHYDRPGAVAASTDGATLYVALWGHGAVLALDAKTLETRSTLTAGSHPNTLLLTKEGARLFVACGNDDSVYAFDTATGMMREKINMRLT